MVVRLEIEFGRAVLVGMELFFAEEIYRGLDIA